MSIPDDVLLEMLEQAYEEGCLDGEKSRFGEFDKDRWRLNIANAKEAAE